MVKHKHAELIKQWADGAEIEQRSMNILTTFPPQREAWCPFSGEW